MGRFICMVIMMLVLISCRTVTRTVEIEKEVPVVHTEYRDKVQRDVIYIHDSVYTYQSHDTIYIYKEKVNTVYVGRADTIVRIDSIPVVITKTVYETKEVNRLHSWQIDLMTVGAAVLLLALWYLVYKIKKIV